MIGFPPWPPPARPVRTLHLPEEIHMPEPGLRQRVTEAIAESWKANVGDRFDDLDQECVNRDADAVLPIVRAEVEAAVAEVLEIEAANCAREIDRAVAAEAERDQARSQRGHWQERAELAEESFLRLAAGTPLVCSDDRHEAKVRGLQAELDQLRARVTELEEMLNSAEEDLREQIDHNDRTCEAVADRDKAEAAVDRVRQLAAQWEADSAWTVLGTDGTDSAAAELRNALSSPTADEEQAHAQLIALDEEHGLYPDQQPE